MFAVLMGLRTGGTKSWEAEKNSVIWFTENVCSFEFRSVCGILIVGRKRKQFQSSCHLASQL
jgi:hypothetical protein